MKEEELKRFEIGRGLSIAINVKERELEDIRYAINNIDKVTECMLNLKPNLSLVDLHPSKEILLKILQDEQEKTEKEIKRLQKEFEEL
jgi:hypothetical protein